MLTISEVTDTSISLREDITQEISGNISSASARQVTAVDTPIVSKLPVVLYFVAISGLFGADRSLSKATSEGLTDRITHTGTTVVGTDAVTVTSGNFCIQPVKLSI